MTRYPHHRRTRDQIFDPSPTASPTSEHAWCRFFGRNQHGSVTMSRPRALENIRVVDFSWVRAGPWATRWLGAFGAEIIKIEWPENERGRLPSTTTPQHLEVNPNTSGNFNDTNINKKSLSLNVRSAKGLEVVKRLIAISDIVIENFSSRVLENWGLGY